MATLIESLISGGVTRQDDARLTIARRPVPNRMRQLLELFAAMGVTASFQGLQRSIDFKGADPQTIVFAVLGRWPTIEEAAAFEEPYNGWPHLQALLRSREFRSQFMRRTCEAFPERKRLLFIRIPTSGGTRVFATLDSKHPILPVDLADNRYANPALLARTLGTIFGRMHASNALAFEQPRMAPFVDDPVTQAPSPDPLGWHAGAPPCRTGDTLFAIMRDPEERALAYTNTALAAFRSGNLPLPATIQAELGFTPKQDVKTVPVSTWQEVGRAVLAHALLKNPICNALGSDSADGARAACARAPIQLVPFDQFTVWGRSALDTIPADPLEPPEAVLRSEDLKPADREAIARATNDDRILHERFSAKVKAAGVPSIDGRDL